MQQILAISEFSAIMCQFTVIASAVDSDIQIQSTCVLRQMRPIIYFVFYKQWEDSLLSSRP